jgi:ABC-type dipeptide/oligopeptide/nickel transport system ATPase subunit
MRFPDRGTDECCLRLLPGKSTLALALLRLIPTEGKVFIDGIATDKINLDALRSKITIIPQDPTLCVDPSTAVGAPELITLARRQLLGLAPSQPRPL